MLKSRKYFTLLLIIIIFLILLVTKPVLLNKIESSIKKNIEENFNINLVIKKIDGNIFSYLNFYSISLFDKNNNKLASADKLTIKYNIFHYLLKERSLINSINIIQPSFKIIRRKDGIWNIEELFKMSPKEVARVKLLPIINVKDGKLLLIDKYQDFNINFDKINGSIDQLGKIKMIAKVMDASYIYITGFLQVDEPNLLLTIKSRRQNLSPYSKLVSNDYFNIHSGKFDIEMKLTYIDTLMYNGKMSLKDTTIQTTYFDDSLKNINGEIFFTNNSLLINNLEMNLGSSSMRVKGTIFNYNVAPMINLLLRWNNLNKKYIAAIFPQIDNTKLDFVNIDCDLLLFDRLSTPKIIGNLFIKEGRYEDKKFSNLSASIRYHNKKLEITDANLQTFKGDINLQGVIRFDKEPKYVVTLSTENINYNNIQLDGDAIITSASSPKILANLNIKNYKNIENINCLLSYKDEEAAIHELIAEIGNSFIIGNGEIKKENIDLAINGRDINLAYLNKDVEGKAHINGKVNGELTNPIFNGYVDIKSGKLHLKKVNNILDFDTLSSKLILFDDTLQIEDMYISSPDYNIKTTGKINLKDKYLKVVIAMNEIDLNRIQKFSGKEITISGKLQGNINIHGYFDRFQNLTIEGFLFSDNINLYNQVIDNSYSTLNIINNQLTFTTSTQINEAPIEVKGKIYLTEDYKTDIVFNASGLELSDINFIKKYREIGGKVEINGILTGSLKSPSLNAVISGENIWVEDEVIKNLTGNIRLTEDKLEIDQNFEIATGKYEIKNVLEKGKGDTFLLSTMCKIKDGDIRSISNISKIEKIEQLKGHFDTNCKILTEIKKEADKFTYRFPYYYLDIVTADLFLKDTPLGKIVANISHDNNLLSINNFLLKTEEGEITANGVIDELGEVDLEAIGKNINIEVIKPYFEFEEELSGNLNFTLTAKGKANSPLIMSEIHIDEIKIYDMEFDKLKGKVEFKDNLFYLRDLILGKGDEFYAKLGGYFPFNFETLQIPREADININITIEDANLRVTKLIGKFIEEIDGNLKSNISVTGNLDNLKVDGTVALKANEVKLAQLEEKIKKLDSEIKIVENRIVFEKVTGKIGRGKFKISGDIEVEMKENKASPKYYNLQFVADNITISLPPNLKGNINSRITLRGDAEESNMEGFIEAENFDYVLVLKPRDVELKEVLPFPATTNINLKLIAGDDFWMRNANLRMKATGEFHLKGKLDELQITGQLKSTRGTLAYLQRVFEIKEAVILFEDPYEFVPTLFIEAATFIEVEQGGKTYRVPVKIVLDTRLRKEKEKLLTPDEEYTTIQLTCDDSHLPHPIIKDEARKEEEIVKYLTGVAFFEEKDMEKALLKEVELMLERNILMFRVFAPIEEEVERLLGLTEFKLDYTLEREIQINIGKYVIKNLEIHLQKIFSQERNHTFSLRYLLSPRRYISFPISFDLIQKGEYTEYRSGIGIKYEF